MGIRRLCKFCGSNELNDTFCETCGRSVVVTETMPFPRVTPIPEQPRPKRPSMTPTEADLAAAARELSQNRPTKEIHPRDIFEPSWPMAIAALERLSADGMIDYIESFRLGICAQLMILVREISQQGTTVDRVQRMRKLTDALAKIPMER